MEIRLKTLAGATALLGLVAAAGIAVAALGPRLPLAFAPLSVPIEGPVPPIEPEFPWTVPTPTPEAAELVPDDQSAAWDWNWQAECLPKLADLLRQYRARRITFTLTGDASLSLGVAYPSMGEAAAIGLTRCEGKADELHCQVAIGKGTPGPDLDTATTAAAVYGVEQYFRPKARQDWEERTAWSWAHFAPFLVKEGEAWRSSCVTVSAS
jgi:hypothetical protein